MGNGDPLPGHEQPYHHLRTVGPPVPGVTILTEAFCPLTFKVAGGRIPKDKVKLQVEEIPDPLKEPPFYLVLALCQEVQGTVEVLELKLLELRSEDLLLPSHQREL